LICLKRQALRANGLSLSRNPEARCARIVLRTISENANLRAREVKAMSAGSSPDGVYVVPSELDNQISQGPKAISPIRQIAAVRTISANVFKKPFMTAGPAVGWVGETDARTQTTSPTLDELQFPAMELYPHAGRDRDSARRRRGQHRPVAGAGSGVRLRHSGRRGVRRRRRLQQAKGFLSYTTVAPSSWSCGNIGYIATGAFLSSNPSDALVDLIYSVNAGHRQTACS
jgi:predicted phage gp36 major capsid-like protein